MSAALRQEVPWTERRSVDSSAPPVCDAPCLQSLLSGDGVSMLTRTGACVDGHYSPLGTLLLQSGEETVRARFHMAITSQSHRNHLAITSQSHRNHIAITP